MCRQRGAENVSNARQENPGSPYDFAPGAHQNRPPAGMLPKLSLRFTGTRHWRADSDELES